MQYVFISSFTTHGPRHDNQVRYAETQSFQITQGYVLQAEIVIGCEDPVDSEDPNALANVRNSALNTTLELQYSINHGRTWQLVSEVSPQKLLVCGLHLDFSSCTSRIFNLKWK